MAKREVNTNEINEESILDSIVEERKEKSVTKPVKDNSTSNEPRKQEEKRKRRNNQPDYETLFIKESEVTTRQARHVYIRTDFHDHISKITHVIANNKMSIFSYIDNVLARHFEEFQEEISKIYKEKNKDLF